MSSAGGRLSRSSPKRIGSVDPYALKIPAPKGRNTHYRWNATSPLHAEPEQDVNDIWDYIANDSIEAMVRAFIISSDGRKWLELSTEVYATVQAELR